MDRFAAALAGAKGLGAKTIRQLIETFGSAEAVWSASDLDLRSARILSPKRMTDLQVYRRQTDPDGVAENMVQCGIQCCTWKEKGYPRLLKETANPPAILFYKGATPVWEKTIGIVGARKSTAYGKQTAKTMAEELSRSGVTIVSGGARGIDSASHVGCLKGKSPTVMVAGFGLDVVYPAENDTLFARIVGEGGTLLSEYPLGTPALGRQFPARNRIIAGMSRGLLVVEAAERSGSLITSDFALEEGRDVFAVPGSIWSPSSRGTNQLIRNGAICCTSANDILSEYGWDTKDVEEKTSIEELTLEEELVYRFCCIGDEVNDEDILQQSGLSVAKVTIVLLQLQLKGYIEETSPGHFIRTGKG